ncbi:hypothetical protein D9757_008222 [Collybiopsis confluens]|uniref:NAD(P)-binding protein n=1 Tax=Collybiopsis confluens TaxID=2823264 RepID=A0A8H5M3U1_9AGAR|nr:hypothetical protein D9757_008222 [Collybiopsis confluens]
MSSSSENSGFVPILDDQLFEHAERLRDKVVVITGAASGIGKETALRFASYGAKVVIGDINLADAQKTVNDITATKGQAVAMKCNVAAWEDSVALFELAIEKYGSVDVVIPNAGVGEPESFLRVTLGKDRKPQKPNLPTVQVNLVGVLYAVYLAQHYLLINRTDKESLKAIVLLGSMSSWAAFPPAPTYTATKHAVLGLMRSLDPILAVQNIRIACITPFFADTNILPIIVKAALIGVPLTPVPRIAGAIVYAASHPDQTTSGCGYVLPDNGPVYKVPREEFKAGVYKIMDDRANSLLQGVKGVVYVARFARDTARVFAKPAILTAGVVGAALLYRNGHNLNLRRFINL